MGLKGAEKCGNCWERVGIKGSVFISKHKGMVVCRQKHGHNPLGELLMRREKINKGVKLMQRKKEMEPR